MIVCRVHAGGTERRDGLAGQFTHVIDSAAQRFQALIFDIFMFGHEIAGRPPVAGDGNRLPLGDIFVSAKMLGELARGYFDHGHL